jgi:hypothetical protein
MKTLFIVSLLFLLCGCASYREEWRRDEKDDPRPMIERGDWRLYDPTSRPTESRPVGR